jgi:hypothetical protein
MTGFQGDLVCRTHGWAPHVFIHEAAHAVAAIDHGIPFEGVLIHSPSSWEANNNNEMMLGGVNVGPDPAA